MSGVVISILSIITGLICISITNTFGSESQLEQSDAEESKCSTLTVGEQHFVDVSEISRKGDGIARIGECVVFVPNAEVGDTLTIEIDNVGNRFATAHRAD
jgi:predicted RNA-binding protein with TRAM domain